MHIYAENWKSLGPFFGNVLSRGVSVPLCRTYAESRFAAGRKPSTVNTELLRLRTALRWAEANGIIDSAPRVCVPSPGKPRDRVLTAEEVERILQGCASGHIQLFVILAIATGGRHRALLELTWDRVDFERGTINLRAPRKVEPMSLRHQKGRAMVPMNNLARAALQEARAAALSTYVIEWGGRRVASIKTGLRRACQRAGLPGVTAHTFRHTAASWATEANVPLEQIARFLGHARATTTEAIYSHPDAAFAASAARAIDGKLIKGER